MLVIISRHPLALICQGMLLLGGCIAGGAGYDERFASGNDEMVVTGNDDEGGWERTKPDFTAGLRF